MTRPKPLILCILDGWGHRHDSDHNAIALAHTPHWDRFMAECPHSLIEASALDVGLPEGQMGNSEVGHMNIGAGRVVMQDLPRIDTAVANGSLARHPRLQQFVSNLKQSGGDCHLLGLLSPGGVHSHQDHLAALAKLIAGAGIKVWIHAFLDGRDTPPKSAVGFLKKFEQDLNGVAEFATIGGRYFAMDRDQRWDRVLKAYDTMVVGDAPHRAPTALHAIEEAYLRGETDEFILPTIISGYAGMKDGDGLLMGNFRADRARQILQALVDPAFKGFERRHRPQFVDRLGLVEYSAALNPFMAALFPPESLAHGFGEVISQAGFTQLRIAETEKYAHVTFFFNGGVEAEYPGESRILIPSPKVATYDLKPEMSAFEVTEAIEKAVAEGKFDVIIVNYANGDMVGHSGDLQAAIKAVEAVDRCLGRLATAIEAKGGAMLITADHGNVEQMTDPLTGQPHTAHTTLPVPLVLVGRKHTRLENGRLADIAPTLLALLELPQPQEMTGKSLLQA